MAQKAPPNRAGKGRKQRQLITKVLSEAIPNRVPRSRATPEHKAVSRVPVQTQAQVQPSWAQDQSTSATRVPSGEARGPSCGPLIPPLEPGLVQTDCGGLGAMDNRRASGGGRRQTGEGEQREES